MTTILRTNEFSKGKEWYPGAKRFFVSELPSFHMYHVSAKHIGNIYIFLAKSYFDKDGYEFEEYKFTYYRNGSPVSRKEAKTYLNYNKSFDKCIKE